MSLAKISEYFSGKHKDSETKDPLTDSSMKRRKITTTKKVGNIINWSVPADDGITSFEAEPFTQFDFTGENASTWRFYLKYNSPEGSKRSLGVFLHTIQPPKSENGATYYVTFTATIIHPTNPTQNIFYNGKSQPMNPATKKSWGMMQHINSDMLAALIHPDKTLLVVLEFWLFKESVDDAEAVEDLRKQNLIGELRQISTDEFLTELHEESYNLEFTDTKIKVKDEKIMRAHSYLLAARCKKFRDTMLKEGRKEPGNEYELTLDISEKTMKAIICHICHACLIEDLLEPSQFSDNLFQELVQAANELELDDLKPFLALRKKSPNSTEKDEARETEAVE